MSVVKDVDLEAMPTSIFLNDDDDDVNTHDNYSLKPVRYSGFTQWFHWAKD